MLQELSNDGRPLVAAGTARLRRARHNRVRTVYRFSLAVIPSVDFVPPGVRVSYHARPSRSAGVDRLSSVGRLRHPAPLIPPSSAFLI